ncbi:MAG TPA: HK97 gp10 family phage protein [Acholeplasmataceae bacterium]|nr:HK97 gp10 family phage protein [Acholeplasmataceae bacterium]
MITLDELGVAISNMVNDYAKDIIIKLEERLDETAQEIVKYIRSNAPRSGGSKPFADSFIAEPQGSGINKSIVIFSNEKGKLTHLLEFGFTHRSGKYVGPRPFMRPAYDLLTPKMLEDIKRIIEKGDD